MSQRPIHEVESRWQAQWERDGVYRAGRRPDAEPFYGLVEFPFPSGAGIHTGHARSYVPIDAYMRRQRMLGKDVLYPIGWDAFGLPTENYAIKNKIRPQDATAQNVANFRRQLKALGISFDWSREVDTTDPAYFKWTQWQFLQFVKHGMAYKAVTAINWCPRCKIGLANEEAQGGLCERCGNPVEKREKSQWMIRITSYADRLLSDLEPLDYLDKIKAQQRHWIGKSEGARIAFALRMAGEAEGKYDVTVFTTRPDTIFGVTFLSISPELAKRWMDAGWKASDAAKTYVEAALNRPEEDRSNQAKEKTGVNTGVKAINPINNEEIPVFVADYVLGGYGTGAVMGVPAHDARDAAFAKAFGLPSRGVVMPEVVFSGADSKMFKNPEEAMEFLDQVRQGKIVWDGEGKAVNSGFIDGLPTWKAKEDVVSWLKENKRGEGAITYNLRDWVFSRQRYWGEPIPLVHCEACAKEKQKVLLVHGYAGGASKNWFPWMKESLERAGFDVLAPTMSTANHPNFEAWQAELAPLIAKLGPRDVIVAHSMGGKAIVHALKRANKRVGHLMLVASSLFVDVRDRDWEMLAHLWPGMDLPAVQAFWNAEETPKDLDDLADDKQFIASNDDLFVPGASLVNVPNGWFRQVFDGCGHFQGEAYPELLERILATKHDGWIPLPESQLPLELPPIEAYTPSDDGESPLANISEWVNTTCPACDGPAKRETDTMPNWAGSSWYFLRYTDPKNEQALASSEALKQWMPVDLYNGGMEHTTVHLLYSRFWHKFLWDIGAIPRECGSEPYKKRRSQGLVLASDGSKMSKSKGNVVNPDDVVETHGADVLRAYLMFMGPFDQPVPWDMNGIEGVRKFLDRVWNLFESGSSIEETNDLRTLYHQTLKKIGEGIERLQFNTCISQLMILTNAYQAGGGIPASHREGFLQMLAPIVPHMAEELWQKEGKTETIHLSTWPTYDETALEADSYALVVQVNGKVRGKIMIARDTDEKTAVALAMEDEQVRRWIANGAQIKKTVFVKGRLMNLIV